MLVTRAIVWQQCGVVLTAWAVHVLYRSERPTGEAKKFGRIRRVSSQLPIRSANAIVRSILPHASKKVNLSDSEDAPVKLKG